MAGWGMTEVQPQDISGRHDHEGFIVLRYIWAVEKNPLFTAHSFNVVQQNSFSNINTHFLVKFILPSETSSSVTGSPRV